jgi:hypothetical protein
LDNYLQSWNPLSTLATCGGKSPKFLFSKSSVMTGFPRKTETCCARCVRKTGHLRVSGFVRYVVTPGFPGKIERNTPLSSETRRKPHVFFVAVGNSLSVLRNSQRNNAQQTKSELQFFQGSPRIFTQHAVQLCATKVFLLRSLPPLGGGAQHTRSNSATREVENARYGSGGGSGDGQRTPPRH